MSAKRILVVEDDAVTAKAVCSKLKARGYEVLAAADSSEVVATVKESQPDLIILDLNIARNPLEGGVAWDGFGILAWLNMQPGKLIPTVVVTVMDPSQAKKRSMDAGAVAFFQKPVKDKELFQTIELALSNPLRRAA